MKGLTEKRANKLAYMIFNTEYEEGSEKEICVGVEGCKFVFVGNREVCPGYYQDALDAGIEKRSAIITKIASNLQEAVMKRINENQVF